MIGLRVATCLATVCIALLASLTRASFAGDIRQDVLRVCADPNNLPFSNQQGQGFENKIAELMAQDFHVPLSYTWWAQRRGFVRNTLKAGYCDVIVGTAALDMIDVTKPYYRSGYVLVSRAADHHTFTSLAAPELRTLRVGVQLIGDDGFNTPPAHALGDENIVDNVVGFPVYGDYTNDSPPSAIVDAVSKGDVDVAAIWGPLAGYYAAKSQVPLRVAAISGTDAFRPLVFEFGIGMGVRKGDSVLKDKIDDFLVRRRCDIDAVLSAYGVPRF